MLKKTIFAIVAVFLSLSLVNAIIEGQELTQAQVNGFNLNQVTFQFLDFRPEGSGRLDTGFYYHDFSYLTLTTQNKTQYPYIVIREHTSLNAPVELISICFITPENCAQAQQDILNYVQPQRQMVLDNVKQKIYLYQHKTILDMIEGWIRGLFT